MNKYIGVIGKVSKGRIIVTAVSTDRIVGYSQPVRSQSAEEVVDHAPIELPKVVNKKEVSVDSPFIDIVQRNRKKIIAEKKAHEKHMRTIMRRREIANEVLDLFGLPSIEEIFKKGN